MCCCPLCRPYTKDKRGGGYGRRAICVQRGQSSWSVMPTNIRSRIGPTKNGRSETPMSDVFSMDEYHNHHHVLEPILPLFTQPSVLVTPSVPVTTAQSTMTTTPAIPLKGGVALFSRIGGVKKWGVRRRRGTSSTSSEVIAAESQLHEKPDRSPRPKTSISSFTRETSMSSSYPSTPNGTSSTADTTGTGPTTTQHTHTHWFFRASSGTGSPGTSSSTRPGSSGRDSIGPKQRRSTSRNRTHERGGDRDAGDARVGSSSSRQPPGAVGNGGGDWNASWTSLRLTVGLQRESVMENSPSASRPSSPLPSMQEVSARKTQVSYSGRRPSFSGANTQTVERAAQTPLTPSKLIKRKSLGFVRLGFGGGGAHATEEKQPAGKYPGLGLGLG